MWWLIAALCAGFGLGYTTCALMVTSKIAEAQAILDRAQQHLDRAERDA